MIKNSIKALLVTGLLVAAGAHAANSRSELLNRVDQLTKDETRSSLSPAQLYSAIQYRIDQFQLLCGKEIQPNSEMPYSDPLAHGLYIYLRKTPPFLLAASIITPSNGGYIVVANRHEVTAGDPLPRHPGEGAVAYVKFLVSFSGNTVNTVSPNVLGTDLGEFDLCRMAQ